jgi:hypothetical protein
MSDALKANIIDFFLDVIRCNSFECSTCCKVMQLLYLVKFVFLYEGNIVFVTE